MLILVRFRLQFTAGIWHLLTVSISLLSMRQVLQALGKSIVPIIDFFYPLFSKVMPKQTFRYLACGGFNTLMGLSAYYIMFRFVLSRGDFDFGFYAFKGHNAALFVSFMVSLLLGFFLMKYVVFTDSYMKGRIQLFRYFITSLFNLVLNYFLLKILVEYWQVYPVFAQIATTFFIVVFSYIAQRHFSFKAKKEDA